MKKIFALFLLCSLLLLSFIACDRNANENNENEQNKTSENNSGDEGNSSDYIGLENVPTKQNLEKNNDDTDTNESNEQSTQTQCPETLKADAISLEKYIGTWYDDFIPPHDLEIISKDNGAIECRLGIYRLTTFYLIITVEDGEISFVDKYNFISGKIVLKDNSVFLMVEESNIEEIQSGANWLFTIKDETNVE